MFKIIKRNSTKKKGKVLKTFYYKNSFLNYLNNKDCLKTLQNSITDENDFIDFEQNNNIIYTIYPVDMNVEYWEIKTVENKAKYLKTRGDY